ncbi:DUF5683 domain-containing protein [Aquimarina megaterium]|uniref:DUF5683 domain-containing protein n=1 Tax=Aquimarina megaterium TaxID=1443666 RepID=UPI0004720992|nr:DUF5683 domain-containing protein [Aquimarina megaterium]
MKIKFFYIIFFVLLSIQNVLSQENEELKVITEEVPVKKKKRERKVRPYEPLAPARAAFYSAVLPGLGQAYTKKYWKVPIVYAALGTGIYFYIDNNKKYNRVRDIYKSRLAGVNPETLELPGATNDQLISLQERFRREKELSLLITVGVYLLNIVDANVTAHLLQYNVTEDLSFKPKINFNEFDTRPNYGVSLNYSF